MSSFDKMVTWPVGYFRSTTSWLLRNRKEIGARISTLRAEIDRIGHVSVGYEVSTSEDGKTETRSSLDVTRGSNVGMLMQAYVANGGNPLDISPFMHPQESFPHGGVVYPLSVDDHEDHLPVMIKDGDTETDSGYGASMGGWLKTDRYYAPRQGGRVDQGSYDSDTIVTGMHQVRKWANQEIKTRLQDMEWRIMKQCDLREQLTKEADDVLREAFGGVVSGVDEPDDGRFDSNLLVQNIVQEMYQLIYQTGESGLVSSFAPNPLVPLYGFTFKNVESEMNRFEMGC